ncbi:TMEM198/TM7SF3 family protein [Amycolatopsis acidicola]|uniref:TMEM198/TM7SF3 family protein n=1 Tax=Amycolatopsis acidicola TaxID=2596893 RepID=A0A5N0V863_9PSEU|nr:TMEM198/TM7SF3 family protein [Amycolatopsis acidicola]KAA9162589.1 TMEM198/TM7SF3 family protein [Amycolatopsis acidicola]
MNTTGLVVLAVGLLLCYAGVRSVNLAVLASGFAIGWLITEPFSATFLTALIVGLACAVGAWVLAHLVFRVALFFVGGLAGAVIGAKVFGLLQPEDRSVVLVIIFVAATGFLGGLVTQRFRRPALAAICALGGAALVLSGLARSFPHVFTFLRNPAGNWQAAFAAIVWVALACTGWVVQRKAKDKAAQSR